MSRFDVILQRVLVSTFGSAGDLFPLIPVARELKSRGVDVRFAVPRVLSLQLRLLGFPCIALGDGSELNFQRDSALLSFERDHWAAWRHVVRQYVTPTLASDVARLSSLFSQWRPDVTVAGSFAAASRVTAREIGIEVVNLSIYPQMVSNDAVSAPSVEFDLGEMPEELSGLFDDLDVRLIFGDRRTTALMHERVLLAQRPEIESSVIGYPYWDAFDFADHAPDEAEEWAKKDNSRPVVLVTFGSFLGALSTTAVQQLVSAVNGAGGRALVIGPARLAQPRADSTDLLELGFIPLSRVGHVADMAVHHGGIGTSVGCMRLGLPAGILPQAFDQYYNAQLLSDVNAGRLLDASRIDESIVNFMRADELRIDAQAASAGMTSDAESISAAIDYVQAAV